MSRNKKIIIGVVVSSIVGGGFVYKWQTRDTICFKKHDFQKNTNLQTGSPYFSAITEARRIAERYRNEIGTPGMVIGASVDGKIIWEEGFGYANLETQTSCHAGTVMRIASISKPITMALLAKLWEDGKVDLDEKVQKYVPYFPEKEFEGNKVDITTRLLACHKSGVRHYKKKDELDKEANKGKKGDTAFKEFYLTKKFSDLPSSIDLFKDDELLFKPGTSYSYTTHGYTLLSAVIESAGGKPFTKSIRELFKILGLKNTYLDEVNTIIPYRSSYYSKSENGRIINAELADNSYKWAGGGFLSTVGDLQLFGNSMLYNYQQTPSHKPGYLKQSTVKQLWTVVEETTSSWDLDAGYGLGWTVVPESSSVGGVPKRKFLVGHSGGAVGASSVLVVLPRENVNNNQSLPQGVVVAILVNLEDVSVSKMGKEIAELFYKVDESKYNAS